MNSKLRGFIQFTENEILGKNSPSSICIGIAIPFYIVKIIFLLETVYFITLHRITYPKIFDATILGSEIADSIIILIFSSVIIFFGFQKFFYRILFPIGAASIVLFSFFQDNGQFLDFIPSEIKINLTAWKFFINILIL